MEGFSDDEKDDRDEPRLYSGEQIQQLKGKEPDSYVEVRKDDQIPKQENKDSKTGSPDQNEENSTSNFSRNENHNSETQALFENNCQTQTSLQTNPSFKNQQQLCSPHKMLSDEAPLELETLSTLKNLSEQVNNTENDNYEDSELQEKKLNNEKNGLLQIERQQEEFVKLNQEIKKQMNETIQQLELALSQAENERDTLKEKQSDLHLEIQQNTETIQQLGEKNKELEDKVEEMNEQVNKKTLEFNDQQTNFQKMQSEHYFTLKEKSELQQQLEDLTKKVKELEEVTITQRSQLGLHENDNKKLIEELEEQIINQKESFTEFKSVEERLSKNLEEKILEVKNKELQNSQNQDKLEQLSEEISNHINDLNSLKIAKQNLENEKKELQKLFDVQKQQLQDSRFTFENIIGNLNDQLNQKDTNLSNKENQLIREKELNQQNKEQLIKLKQSNKQLEDNLKGESIQKQKKELEIEICSQEIQKNKFQFEQIQNQQKIDFEQRIKKQQFVNAALQKTNKKLNSYNNLLIEKRKEDNQSTYNLIQSELQKQLIDSSNKNKRYQKKYQKILQYEQTCVDYIEVISANQHAIVHQNVIQQIIRTQSNSSQENYINNQHLMPKTEYPKKESQKKQIIMEKGSLKRDEGILERTHNQNQIEDLKENPFIQSLLNELRKQQAFNYEEFNEINLSDDNQKEYNSEFNIPLNQIEEQPTNCIPMDSSYFKEELRKNYEGTNKPKFINPPTDIQLKVEEEFRYNKQMQSNLNEQFQILQVTKLSQVRGDGNCCYRSLVNYYMALKINELQSDKNELNEFFSDILKIDFSSITDLESIFTKNFNKEQIILICKQQMKEFFKTISVSDNPLKQFNLILNDPQFDFGLQLFIRSLLIIILNEAMSKSQLFKYIISQETLIDPIYQINSEGGDSALYSVMASFFNCKIIFIQSKGTIQAENYDCFDKIEPNESLKRLTFKNTENIKVWLNSGHYYMIFSQDGFNLFQYV